MKISEKERRLVVKAVQEVFKAKDGDFKMIFGKPYTFSGGEWKAGGSGKAKESDKKEEPERTVGSRIFENTSKDPGYNKLSNTILKKVDDESVASLKTYVAESQQINGILRKNGRTPKEDDLKDVENIDRAFKSAEPLPHDTIVYRGASLPSSLVNSLKVGSSIKDEGFVSTSQSEKIALSFIQESSPDKGKTHVLFTILAEKGSKVLPVSELHKEGGVSAEKELLMNRGTSFIVHSLEPPDKDGVVNVVVKVGK